ncbi:response regulator [archaeon]|nr:MAG: response regulator [archaeon]
MLGVDNALETLFAIRQIMEQVDSAKANCIAHLLSSAELCLSNCRKTNQFMFMSINRMMDCAKSARGLLLSPKYETASLLESLKLPLDCVRSLRSEVLIVLEPLPEELSRYIITDKQWLQENLLCLLSNAVKYSHRGNVTVRTKLQRSQGSIRFEVEDEGIGMSEEVMDSLFSPFQQSQRLAGGTGLGLFSLAKRIEALKGDCGVQKRGDGKQGSLFWFSMRYRPDDSVDMSGAAEQLVAECELQSIDSISTCGDGGYSSGSSIASTHHIFSQDSADEDSRITETFTEAPALTGVISQSIYIPRVLLVEDTLSIMKMTSMMLCRQGYEVVTASNGAAALDLIEAEYREFEEGSRSNALVFDVVLMDLQMPIMDGIEATKRLRRWEQQGCTSSGYKVPLHRNQQLKIVGLSANSDEAVLQATRHAGFDGFISKPFRMAALLHFLS